MVRFFFLLSLLISSLGFAKDAKTSLPYLGPGSDVMSPEEYQRVYKNYIQLSVLLGYPFMEGAAPPCDHDLKTIFRQAGFFNYPVPNEAQQVQRGNFKSEGFSVETYAMGGVAIQVVRDAKGALDRLVLVNSATPKATRKLEDIFRHEILSLERDSRTGLEKVKGLPVGYPHPLLTDDAQGLYVKILKFNDKIDGCEPVAFLDNTWVGGYSLTGKDCVSLKGEVEQVWRGKVSAHNFAVNQMSEMKAHALKSAMSKGLSEEEAQKIIRRNFVQPIVSDVNVIGNSMRNLAQCNSLAFGAGKSTGTIGNTAPATGEGKTTPDGKSAQ